MSNLKAIVNCASFEDYLTYPNKETVDKLFLTPEEDVVQDNDTIIIDDGKMYARALLVTDEPSISGDYIKARLDYLTTRVSGYGGYLHVANLGTNPTQTQLFTYAKQELGVTENNQIPNQTKIKNNSEVWILNNIPGKPLAWVDIGEETVSIADTQTAGVIFSSLGNLEGSVSASGVLTINGLEDALSSINSSLSSKVNTSTYQLEIEGINDNLTTLTQADEDQSSDITSLQNKVDTLENADLITRMSQVESALTPLQANIRLTSQSKTDTTYVREWAPDSNGKVWCECGLVGYTLASETTLSLPVMFEDSNFFVTVTPREQGNFHTYIIPNNGSTVRVRVTDVNGYAIGILVYIEAKGYKKVI